MHSTSIGGAIPASRPLPSTEWAAFAASADGLRRFRIGLRLWRLARLTRQATEGLEDRMRDDVGLAPRGPAPPAVVLSPMATSWMR